MDNAIIGFLALVGIIHLLLIAIPIGTTLRAPISLQSKILWCAFLVLIPFGGAAFFHFRYRSGLFRGKPWEPSAHELGARNWRDSNDDKK